MRVLRLFVLPAILALAALPALAEAVSVQIISATSNAGSRTATLVVKTSPNAVCDAQEEVNLHGVSHVGLGRKTADPDGALTWNFRFDYPGPKHITLTCSAGSDRGSASADVTVQ